MKVLIVRHGDPDYDIDSLTEKGWKEVEYLSQKQGIEPERVHRATDDAKTTALVYLKLRQLYYEKKEPPIAP